VSCWAAPRSRRSATDVSAHPAGARLLLVPPLPATRSRRSGIPTSCRRRGAAAGAVRRLDQLFARQGGAWRIRMAESCAASWEEKCCRASSKSSAGTRRRRGGEAHRDPRPRRMGCRRRRMVVEFYFYKQFNVFSSARLRWKTTRTSARAPRRRRSRGAPAGNSASWPTALADRVAAAPHRQVARRAPRSQDRARRAALHAVGGVPPDRGGEVTTLTPGALHAQNTNTSVGARRSPVPQGYRALRSGCIPTSRSGAKPHRRGEVQARRAARRVCRVRGQHEATTLAAAGLRAEPGRRWSYTLAYSSVSRIEALGEGHGGFLALMQNARGAHRRAARAFAAAKGDPAFIPNRSAAKTSKPGAPRVREEALQTISMVEKINEGKKEILSFIYASPREDALAGARATTATTTSARCWFRTTTPDHRLRRRAVAPAREARRKHSPLRRRRRHAALVQLRARLDRDATASVPAVRARAALRAWEAQTREASSRPTRTPPPAAACTKASTTCAACCASPRWRKVLYGCATRRTPTRCLHIPLQGLTALLQGG